MSEEQQVSEALERIWIDGDEVARAIRNRVGSYYTHPSPDDASNRDIEYVRADSSPVAPPARPYFCSCGGALTAEEYITHFFELGHDRGATAVAQPPEQDDTDILDDERVDKELHRWQDGIRDKLIAMGAPDWKIDGAGCDSGDPLDFTLAEVGQGVGYFIDRLEELRVETLKGICVYCGEVQQYESLEQKSGAAGNQIRVEHIKKCTQRPELKLIAYCEALQDACQQFVHWYAEDSTEEKRDNAYDAAVAALALPTALTKPQPLTSSSAEVAREIVEDWYYKVCTPRFENDNELPELEQRIASALTTAALAQEIVARWKADIGKVVKYERMEADIAAALNSAALRGAERLPHKIDVDWALRELADGWIQNNEREGPHGFYQNARRVLAAIANNAVERQREVDAPERDDYQPCPDSRCNDHLGAAPMPQCVTAVYWAEEAQAIANTLRELAGQFDTIDNGCCTVCRVGHRLWTIPGKKKGPCDYAACLSHRIAEILTRYEPVSPETLERIHRKAAAAIRNSLNPTKE